MEAGAEAKQASAPQNEDVERIERKTGLRFVSIPAGSFMMGSNESADSKPIHRVELDGFYMSKTEVTVGQYEAYCKVTGKAIPYAPSFNAGWSAKDHPIVNVSWDDAKGYCSWAGADLPTEAEWEYAARGGVEGKRFPWGDEWDASKCASNLNGTAKVGSYAANDYGLYDMAGNVEECCLDFYDANYYANSPTKNPKNIATATEMHQRDHFVLRGGSWYDDGFSLSRCAARSMHDFDPNLTGHSLIGFRVVFRTITPVEAETEAKQTSIPQNANVERIERKTGLKFAAIPAGSFMMGSDKSDNEKPVHKVELDKFYMSKTELTVGQYEAYCKATGKAMPDAPGFNAGWGAKDHPIVNVSWNDAKSYCDWAGVSLPTEAEWEYAARGGLKGKAYPWGDEWDARKCANNQRGAASVGSYPANGYGLHDMAGNVWEWCADWYDDGYYAKSPLKNPLNSAATIAHALRGGSWNNNFPDDFRCATRAKSYPDIWFAHLSGFRVVFR